jgi:hypothetical protein
MNCWTISEIDSAIIGTFATAPHAMAGHNTVSTSSLTTLSSDTSTAAFELCESERTPFRPHRERRYGTACGNIEDRLVAAGPEAEIIGDRFFACT